MCAAAPGRASALAWGGGIVGAWGLAVTGVYHIWEGPRGGKNQSCLESQCFCFLEMET